MKIQEITDNRLRNEIQLEIDRLKARIEDPNDGGNVPFLVQIIKELKQEIS